MAPLLWNILGLVADTLEIRPRKCWYHLGRFHFRLDAEWTIALKPESAGRIRVECCHLTAPCATMWVRVDDLRRLTEIVHELDKVRFAVPEQGRVG